MARSREEIAELAQTLAEQYDRGMTTRQLARRYDVAYGYVHRLLREAGVTMRTRDAAGPYVRNAWRGLSLEQSRDYRQRLAQNGPIKRRR